MKKASHLLKTAAFLLCLSLTAASFSGASPALNKSLFTANAEEEYEEEADYIEEIPVARCKFHDVLITNGYNGDFRILVPNEYGVYNWDGIDVSFADYSYYRDLLRLAERDLSNGIISEDEFEERKREIWAAEDKSMEQYEIIRNVPYNAIVTLDAMVLGMDEDRDLSSKDLLEYSKIISEITISDILKITSQGLHYYGDITDNGVIDSYDLLLMRQVIASEDHSELSDDQFKNADVNKNDEIDEEDLQQLSDYLLGAADGFNTPSAIGSTRLDNTVSVMAEKGTITDEKFAATQMRFGVNMFKKLNEGENKKSNMLISPFSAAAALAMTANGADGDTLKQMEEVLGDDLSIEELDNYMAGFLNKLPDTEKEKVLVANSIWFKDTPSLKVYDSFLETNKKYFSSEIYKTAFDADTVKDINSWVNTNTKGMIPKLLSPNDIDESTAMALINTLYFDAEWQNKYDDSTETKFTTKDGQEKKIDGLYGSSDNYYELDNAIAFKRAYAGDYKFVGILPDEGIDIDDYIAGLDPAKLSEQLSTPGDMDNVIVHTMIPEFEYDYGCSMADTLKDLGMKNAFDSNFADFSKINDLSVEGANSLYISNVLQKTNIKLTKEGTKAAAATAVIMAAGAGINPNPPRYIYIYLNRPFVYMIVDKHDVPVFIGSISDIGK
ncbi:serpin family protein [Ruminococcus sp. XPD3002]|uniref:serpin family protein n=1 Tax=Ruminococcus sp. XPD3002 TaxID=1452269 RepID=UPI0009165619|nr:Serine protease inhibitor [Ruminococcus flavefaciens]